MAKKELLEDIENVIEGADMQSSKPINANTDEVIMKQKLIKIPKDWDDKIRGFIGKNTSGYIVNAVRKQLREDGLI